MSSQTFHPEVSPADGESAVRDLYRELMEAWNDGSGEAFAAVFTEEGDLIGFDGVRFKGRREIAPFHQRLFETFLKGTRLVGQVTDMRFLSPEVARCTPAAARCCSVRPARERDSIQTLVAVKRDGEWRLAAFQNTRARPMGRDARGTMIWLFTDWLWKVMGPKNK
jgi:uncharacterized protein (TIGR02246 family)